MNIFDQSWVRSNLRLKFDTTEDAAHGGAD
jgi:hypothetical protein